MADTPFNSYEGDDPCGFVSHAQEFAGEVTGALRTLGRINEEPGS